MVNTVRAGQKVWPTCTECGCRLEVNEKNGFLTHFGNHPNKDARGCECKNLWLGWIVMGEAYLTLTSYNRV